MILTELKPTAVFGEMVIVGRCMYHCSSQTAELSCIHILEPLNWKSLFEQCPIITRLLLERAQRESVEDPTQKEMAEHLPEYRESVTTALGQLGKAGIIAVDRKLIPPSQLAGTCRPLMRHRL